jgi:mono/diheme cytochrome c family protein
MRSKSRPLFLISSFAAALGLAAFLFACGQNYNSDSNDASGSAAACPDVSNTCTAYAAMAKNHCFQCHPWGGFTTDAQWLNAGLVSRGNPTVSSLIKELKNSGGQMPKDYSPLSTADYNKLVTWIQNM